MAKTEYINLQNQLVELELRIGNINNTIADLHKAKAALENYKAKVKERIKLIEQTNYNQFNK
jgi:hypothetical protein